MIGLWLVAMEAATESVLASIPESDRPKPVSLTAKDRLFGLAYYCILAVEAALFVAAPVGLLLMILFAAFPFEFTQLFGG